MNTLEDLIARFGPPHMWGPWERLVNFWRLLAEHVQIRVLIDVAIHCPDEALRQRALAQFRGIDNVARLDSEWPGIGAFTYDWHKP
jgi:hypothetical protein